MMIYYLTKIKKIAFIVLLTIVFQTAFFSSGYITPAAERPPVSVNRVMISDYYVVGGGLVAGEINTAVFILKNTGETSWVTSLLLTGWIDSGAPVDFDGTNQVYVPYIMPRGEVAVEFTYYTKNVDLTLIDTISAGFAINYGDEGSGAERVNNVSFRPPILYVSPSRPHEAANTIALA